jgi:hypothetical protein
MPIGVVEQLAGLCVLMVILLDIFLTVLYARAGTGLIAPHVERALWQVIRHISTVSRRSRERILSVGGPLLVIAVVAMWFVGLSFGAALVIHPALGTGVKTTSGDTPLSFIAALFAGGSSVSIVGSSGLEPDTKTFRLFYFLTALSGTTATSLVLTYLMQVYTALLRRNTVALDVDTWSGQTGDAVELLTRLFPDGQTSAGYNVIVQWASALTSTKETHHFYPVLCYFRFTDARYSMARAAFVTLETAALIRTALGARQFGWVRRSAALEQLEASARMLLDTLARESGVPMGSVDGNETAVRRHRRFISAVARLQHGGMEVTDGLEAGAAEYARLRAGWDVPAVRLADFLGYTPQQIDVSTERIVETRPTP